MEKNNTKGEPERFDSVNVNQGQKSYDSETSPDPDSFTQQQEEIETLREIYTSEEDGLEITSVGNRHHKLRICIEGCELNITLPETYPLGNAPPSVFISNWLGSSEQLKALKEELNEIYLPGEVILFQWVEQVRSFVSEHICVLESQSSEESIHEATDLQQSETHDKELRLQNASSLYPNVQIHHGEPFCIKKSTFQAHLARVKTVGEAIFVYSKLVQDKELKKVTHNMMAYRIINSDGTIIADNDDDGEAAAGSRLAHLLEIVGAENVIVVVSRWYGGILLGPKRFKYICNVARELLVKCQLIR
mmetsp:Transcript_15873/g.17916  ORF Transcript_15873/g.17916 Transcript_15873/m.17916 type:complete len:305 (+) Transcript_15873:34-948(+)